MRVRGESYTKNHSARYNRGVQATMIKGEWFYGEESQWISTYEMDVQVSYRCDLKVVVWNAFQRYHIHSWYPYHEMPGKWWKVWSSGTKRTSGIHIRPTARDGCTRLTYVNHYKDRDTWNGESGWYTIPKGKRAGIWRFRCALYRMDRAPPV